MAEIPSPLLASNTLPVPEARCQLHEECVCGLQAAGLRPVGPPGVFGTSQHTFTSVPISALIPLLWAVERFSGRGALARVLGMSSSQKLY